MLVSTTCARCGLPLPMTPSGGRAAFCPSCGASARANLDQTAARSRPAPAPAKAGGLTDTEWLKLGGQEPAGLATVPDLQSSGVSESVFQPGAAEGEPDRALIQFALGFFRVRGWPCQELEGHDAFVVQAECAGHQAGRREICNVTVSASEGLLAFETLLMPLPPPPWKALREALNALNLWSSGSVFLLRECGVAARLRLLGHCPRTTGLTVDGLMLALRQLLLDRRLAVPILEEALRTGAAEPAAVLRAYSGAAASGDTAELTADQICGLAAGAGYYAARDGQTAYVSYSPCPVSQCPVQVSASPGVLRAWTVIGEDLEALTAADRWDFLRRTSRVLDGKTPLPSRGQLEPLLERLNALNDGSPLLRYVWSHGTICALAAYPLAGRKVTVEEFRALIQALLRCASDVTKEMDRIRHAV